MNGSKSTIRSDNRKIDLPNNRLTRELRAATFVNTVLAGRGPLPVACGNKGNNMRPCLIFDLDGTLVDSETICNQALLDLLPDLNASTDLLIERYRGRRLSDILRDIELQIGQSLPSDFEASYRKRVTDLFTSELKPIAGACDFLDQSTHTRCIASSGPMHKIVHALTVTGMAKYFDHVFSSYDVGSWKPDPGLFLHAASMMGRLPVECIVIEDSSVGIVAAKAAGMRALRFRPSCGSDDYAAKADGEFTEMAQLPALLSQLERLPNNCINRSAESDGMLNEAAHGLFYSKMSCQGTARTTSERQAADTDSGV
ncbi:MAG: HAD-IA family hydrolase [Planctomycetaceae bacterium]|nr:HAD-IA family hydrolase [Planctomycetaceae bacterium]